VAAHSYFELEVAGLDLARLTLALRRLIARHGMLWAIVLSDGRQQILCQVPPYEIEILDLREQEPAAAAERLRQVRDRMSHQVLPADRWPLFEIRASRVSEDRVRLHVSFDILIVDAWSFRILSRELDRLYRDSETVLPPLELSFRDYVLAEKAFESSDLHRRSWDYWRRRLPELPPAPE